MHRATAFILFIIAALPVAAQKRWDITRFDLSKLPPASGQADLTFDKDIKPLFQASCLPCHGNVKPHHGLRLNNLENALKGGDDGKMIIPGDSEHSLLVIAAARIDDKTAMPPKHHSHGPGGPPPGGFTGGAGTSPPADVSPSAPPPASGGPGGPGPQGHGGPPAKPLTTEQVSLLRAWIDQGAK